VQSQKRTYALHSEEYEQRRALYEKRALDADAQNKRAGKLWTAGVNEFSDWKPAELSTLYGWVDGARPQQAMGGSRRQSIHKADFLQKNTTATLPLAKTWTYLKSLQAVKSQGGCGSCWAVAAVAVLEAATELHSTSRTFSTQEIVNCVPNPQECGGQGGCRGATVELAVDWVMKNGAFEEYQAPYVGSDMPCQNGAQALAAHENKAGNSFGMSGWETLPKNKYEPLLHALAEKGPTAVSVDASPWHMYDHGVFNGCVPDSIINHAVAAVGYGQDKDGIKFWEIQNSWGQHWGEKGRIRMLRRDSDETECGIDNKPELGVGCKGGPSQVTVCGMCGVLYDSVVVHMG